jgi:hypothetical protein
VIILPMKRTWPFIWTNSLHPKIICTKFDWFWPAGSEKKILIYYLPLERGNPLHLNKLESLPSKDDLCKVCLKLAWWFWRRRFLNDPSHFCDYLPFVENLALHLNKLEFSSPRDIL